MTLTIDVFDLKSIDKALAQLEQAKVKADRMVEQVVEEATKAGEEILREEIKTLVYDHDIPGAELRTGELAGSVYSQTDGKTGRIVSGAPYSVYVEMGTGIVGAASPHPDPFVDWSYGDQPWRFWKNGRLWPTFGQISHPFMYNTFRRLVDLMPSIWAGVRFD